MKNLKIPKKYYKIWEDAVPYLLECRSGDLEHSRRLAEKLFEMSHDKEWDLDVLIPVAILHDIGHSAVLPEHFKFISGPNKEDNSKLVHMLAGAKIAKRILKKNNYSEDKIEKIIDIIIIHDKKNKDLFDSEEKKVIHDLDRLDRISEYGIIMSKEEFGLSSEETVKLLEERLLPDLIKDDLRREAHKRLEKLKEKIF